MEIINISINRCIFKLLNSNVLKYLFKENRIFFGQGKQLKNLDICFFYIIANIWNKWRKNKILTTKKFYFFYYNTNKNTINTQYLNEIFYSLTK